MSLESRLGQLEERLQDLEDEREIHKLIVTYGFAADTGDANRVADRFAEEGIYDVGTRAVMNGRQGLREMITGDAHQSLLPNSAHTFGPGVIKVDGIKAVATGSLRRSSTVWSSLKEKVFQAYFSTQGETSWG